MNTICTQGQCASAPQLANHFRVVAAIGTILKRLRQRYAAYFRGREKVLTRALAEAEELAWETPFPHLLLPGFAELRIAELAPARAYALAA